MPMSVGDDYFYTFVYNGQSMLEPLPLDVKKVSSLYDLFGGIRVDKSKE